MLQRIQADVISAHPELQNKSQIFEYFVSLEDPEKQRKLISWWYAIIDCAIRKSGDLYLSPADLQIIFTMHGLKPVPLQRVLQHLSKCNKLEWEGLKKPQPSQKGWLSSLTSYIWKPSSPSPSGYQGLHSHNEERIISVQYKHELLEKLKIIIGRQLGEETVISYEYVMSKLKNQVEIGVKSLEELLDMLKQSKWLFLDTVQDKKIILRNKDQAKMRSPIWHEVEKSKFLLNSSIEQLDRKIQQRIKQQDNKLQQAKQTLQSDQSRAKKILVEVKLLRKTTIEYENRRKLLQQTLESIQINQVTSSTIDVMNSCQAVVKKIMIDPNELEAVKERHLEIAYSQKEINQQFEEMGSQDIEGEVDRMLSELNNEIKAMKQPLGKEKIVHVQRLQKQSEKYYQN